MRQASAGRPLLALWFRGAWIAALRLMVLVVLGVSVAGPVYAAPEAPAAQATNAGGDPAPFQQLDAQVEQILDEVVNLGGEMAVLEETRALSPNTQLLVLVSIEPSAFFQLEAIQLEIDGKTTSFHQYSEPELDALSQGGSHRLFWDNVPAGRHQLVASVMGQVPKDPDFQRQVTLMVDTGEGRRVLELRVATGKNQVFPELLIKEWK
ncbi:MAG: hypothetical protein RRB22_05585 [Gammaproteobacteria bacterium]|nr:hypothetical protein [Gammaproteobacteria bacterium]